MLSHFQFSTAIIIWTLTFAALLVLLVVILGRDRAKLYPLFTFSVGVVAFRLLVTRILYGKLAPLALTWLFVLLALLAALAGILVAVEMARRAFAAASRRTWIIGTIVALIVAAAVLIYWGPWPAWQTITAGGAQAHLRLTQLIAQRADMLASLLAVEVGLLALLFGRRDSAGLRSHTFQIIVGLFVAAISQLSVRAIWQFKATHAVIHTQADYEKIISFQGTLNNGNNIVYIVVLIWWIVCLWNDESGEHAEGVKSEEEMILAWASKYNLFSWGSLALSVIIYVLGGHFRHYLSFEREGVLGILGIILGAAGIFVAKTLRSGQIIGIAGVVMGSLHALPFLWGEFVMPKEWSLPIVESPILSFLRLVAYATLPFLCSIIYILYIRTISQCVKSCDRGSRTMAAGLVWLLLIPFFNIIWHFFVVSNLSKSVRNELRSRDMRGSDPTRGKTLGMAASFFFVCPFLLLGVAASINYMHVAWDPSLGFFFVIELFIGSLMACWILYWVNIARYLKSKSTDVDVGGSNIPGEVH